MAFPETKCSDTFDENTPPIDDPEYISSLGAAIFKGLQSGDAEAVWLMQVKCYIQSFFLFNRPFFRGHYNSSCLSQLHILLTFVAGLLLTFRI